MSFESKGSSNVTAIFKERLDASKGGPLRDRDEDPPHDGGFGKTVDANEIFEARRDAGTDRVKPYLYGIRGVDDPDNPSGHDVVLGEYYADDKIAERAEGQVQEAVATAMREPEVRKAVMDAVFHAKEDSAAIATAEANEAAVDAYTKSSDGHWIR